MSSSILSLCPTLGLLFIVLFLSTLLCVQNQSFFDTCFLRHLGCVLWKFSFYLPEGGICWSFWLFSNLLCYVSISPLFYNIIKFLGSHPRTPSCTSPGMARGQYTLFHTHTHTCTQRKEHAIELSVESATQSHFMLCRLITMKPDHAVVSHSNQTWANWPCSTAPHDFFCQWFSSWT